MKVHADVRKGALQQNASPSLFLEFGVCREGGTLSVGQGATS